MLKILITSFLLSTTLLSTAQTAINGEVIDNATKQPVEGASILLSPNNITTISDANGKFYFKNKLLQQYKTIQINTIGYSAKIITIEAFQQSNTIYLDTKQVQLQFPGLCVIFPANYLRPA